jgi:hypothetical protein
VGEKCLFCEAPAIGLCDNALALVWTGQTEKVKGRPPHAVTSMEAMLSTSYTCDAPFCDQHGKLVGFVCAGKNSDTIDHCCGCVAAEQHRRELMTADQISKLRSNIHAKWRRNQFKPVTKDPPHG